MLNQNDTENKNHFRKWFLLLDVKCDVKIVISWHKLITYISQIRWDSCMSVWKYSDNNDGWVCFLLSTYLGRPTCISWFCMLYKKVNIQFVYFYSTWFCFTWQLELLFFLVFTNARNECFRIFLNDKTKIKLHLHIWIKCLFKNGLKFSPKFLKLAWKFRQNRTSQKGYPTCSSKQE